MSAQVTHHSKDQEFTIEQDGYTAELAYSLPAAGIIDFTHTFVDELLRGKGMGEELAKAGLAYARQQKLKVRTSCAFMQDFVQKHLQYQPLLDDATGQK
ncbi:GNAT family N-acetyltransferase [Hymenobacter swuensis]|nr:GNAT family N-acetyltransferase [Hymenobacter swuensis]